MISLLLRVKASRTYLGPMLAALVPLVLGSFPANLRAETPEEKITTLMREVCESQLNRIKENYSRSEFEAGGRGAVEVNNVVLRALADLGLSGDIAYRTLEESGLPSQYLSELIGDTPGCKERVLKMMKAVYFGETAEQSEDNSEQEKLAYQQEALLSPYSHSWECDMRLHNTDGELVGTAMLTFGKVNSNGQMDFARLENVRSRLKDVPKQIAFQQAQWRFMWCEGREGECMSFLSSSSKEPLIGLNNEYDMEKGELRTSGALMMRTDKQHKGVAKLEGFCRAR